MLAIFGVVEEVSKDEGFDEGLLLMKIVESFAAVGLDHQLASVHPVSVDSERFGIDVWEIHGDRKAWSPVAVA